MAKSDVKVRPVGGKVLVLPDPKEEQTKSGILIPDTVSKEKPQKGTIVALGEGKLSKGGKVMPFRVKVGDKVLFKKYSPDSIEVDDVEYLIMEEEDILGVLS